MNATLAELIGNNLKDPGPALFLESKLHDMKLAKLSEVLKATPYYTNMRVEKVLLVVPVHGVFTTYVAVGRNESAGFERFVLIANVVERSGVFNTKCDVLGETLYLVPKTDDVEAKLVDVGPLAFELRIGQSVRTYRLNGAPRWIENH